MLMKLTPEHKMESKYESKRGKTGDAFFLPQKAEDNISKRE